MKRYFGAFKNYIMLTNKWEQVPEKAKEIPEVSMEMVDE